ncbi:MAG: Transcriptional regulator, MerR family [Ktedonobacterales bacterium]|jgi:DNA-binding transcriptional MerR regulator|nr:MAG: Transcriptional regulator, MerR family [Ktedonobacterales bacterium]
MFRIGEFSLIAQVSGRLLRYYDEIGLLSPEYTDPQTGYRYYSAAQLPHLNRILVLKELGLGLDQIARLLSQGASSEEIRGMLLLRKAQITQAMQDGLDQLHLVEARLDQMDAFGQTPVLDVVVKAIPSQRYLALREVFPDVASVRRLVVHMTTIVPHKMPASSLGQIAFVVHSRMFDPDALDFEVGFLLTGNPGNSGKTPTAFQLSEERVLTVHDLPAVEMMATLVHVGSITDIHRTYGLLGAWVEQQQWQIVGQGRQVLLQLPQPGHDDAVIELQIPVSKAGTPYLQQDM